MYNVLRPYATIPLDLHRYKTDLIDLSPLPRGPLVVCLSRDFSTLELDATLAYLCFCLVFNEFCLEWFMQI